MNELVIVAGIVGTGLTAILAYLFGGSIRKTDANRLWDESRQNLKDVRLEREEFRRERDVLVKRLAAARQANRHRWRLAIPILESCAEGMPDKKAAIEQLIGTVEQEEWDDNGG